VEQVFEPWSAAPLLQRLRDVGVPAGRVRSIDEVYGWDQTRSQGLVVEVDHQTLGRLSLPGPPLRFFDADGDERTPRSHRPPPVLGADNTAVRAWVEEDAPCRG
jgi:formyl-CoA transferase